MFLVYNMNGKLLGMSCKLPTYNSSNTRVCSFCNNLGHQNEVAFVSARCKKPNTADGTYRSIGFNIGLDSKKCNQQIISIENIEKIFKDVNNIK